MKQLGEVEWSPTSDFPLRCFRFWEWSKSGPTFNEIGGSWIMIECIPEHEQMMDDLDLLRKVVKYILW